MDTQAIQRFLTTTDRNRADFFAGREREIASFHQAVSAAQLEKQAVFRVYQGAPGCGKTSLVEYLHKTNAASALFVAVEPEDLVSREALANRIDREGQDQQTANEAIRAGAVLVLHLDEAHARVTEEEKMLVTLHVQGIGLPCVMLLTGLGHTAEQLANIPALSRPARHSVMDMGVLSHEECVASTHMMLKAFRIRGKEAERTAICEQIAAMSHGWPQHLNTAQKVLCEYLLRVNGELTRVDMHRVQQTSGTERHLYYESRIDYPPLNDDARVTLKVLSELSHRGSCPGNDLARICRASIDAGEEENGDLLEYASPATYVDVLMKKGVVSRADLNQMRLAIPSMGTWATARMRRLEMN